VTARLPVRWSARLLLFACLLMPPGAHIAGRAARTPPGNPTVILEGPGGERTIPAVDLAFVFFERIYYRRAAPRSEEATGQRLDIEDRRHECRCVRLEDWSRLKFSKLRQVEFVYPPDDRVARLRVTFLGGQVRELRADSLSGAVESFAPRFSARVDGEVREFLLILPEHGSWPEERLVRLLLRRPTPARGRS